MKQIIMVGLLTLLLSIITIHSATPPPPTTYIQKVYHLLQTLPAYSGEITIIKH